MSDSPFRERCPSVQDAFKDIAQLQDQVAKLESDPATPLNSEFWNSLGRLDCLEEAVTQLQDRLDQMVILNTGRDDRISHVNSAELSNLHRISQIKVQMANLELKVREMDGRPSNAGHLFECPSCSGRLRITVTEG